VEANVKEVVKVAEVELHPVERSVQIGLHSLYNDLKLLLLLDL
jgi:hypothetical protein